MNYNSMPMEKYQDVMEHRQIYYVIIPKLNNKNETKQTD